MPRKGELLRCCQCLPSTLYPSTVIYSSQELGGKFECAPDWNPFAVHDGNLISGQNPMSSQKVAELMVAALK